MQLYRTTYKTDKIDEDGRRITASSWHGSAADASKARTALKAQDKTCEPSTEPAEIPVVKQGLLAFLNTLTN